MAFLSNYPQNVLSCCIMDSGQPQISIVVPTWNRRDLAVTCLRSLAAQTFRDIEIILVDDGSTDGTAEAVARAFPEVRVLRMPENRGFCRAVNAGIRQASASLILLLNNDMTLAVDFLERLAGAAAASDAAMFAPLVLWRDEPETIYAAGDRLRANGRPESIGFREPREGFAFPEGIFGVSAGAGLYRRALFDSVGLLDERFVAYFEDSDLSFRARLAGFRAELVPDAVAYHIGSASIAGRTWWRTRQCFRNHALLVIKDMPRPLLVRHAASIAGERLHQARRLFSAARAEFGAMRAAACLLGAAYSLLREIPHALAERRRIQRGRVIAIEDLEALLTK